MRTEPSIMSALLMALLVTSLSACGSGAELATEAGPGTVPVRPTEVPSPTVPPPTGAPVPEPIVLAGTGDAVLEVDKWPGPAIAHITYHGRSNFIVWNYGPGGERMYLLVSTTGKYEGTRPIDFLEHEQTARFEVTTSGEWEIEVLPLEEIRLVAVPSTFEGSGDDVVRFSGEEPDLLLVDASDAESNFVIWGYGDTTDLLVNEIAPYTGTVVAPDGSSILCIESEGDWVIEVTSR